MNPPRPSGRDRLLALRDENDLHAATMELNRDRFEALRTRKEDGTAPRVVSAFQLFQTPPALAARLVALAGIEPGQSVLEPSAGLGRLLHEILRRSPGDVQAVEIDPALSGELFRTFPQVRLAQGDFLARHFGEFDRVVMNPPFHMRADIRHVKHALTHLKPGGTLAGLCLSSRHRTDALKPLADHWEVIPAGTFKGEGTNVETVLFRITL